MKSRAARALVLPTALVLALLVCGPAAAATITVNTVSDVSADDGVCTLREAITAANGDAPSGVTTGECAGGSGADSIVFSIPGSGQHLITPTTALPNLSTTMSIDGSTDPPQVGLDGSLAGAAIGLYVNGNSVSINDLSIVRWSHGIWIAGPDSTTVSNVRIGTNLAGASGLGNTVVGVLIGSGSTGTVVTDSVVASSAQEGVRINGQTTTGVTLTGNLIGIDPSGTAALPNSEGISITETAGTRIGGPDPGDGNVISSNTGRGIVINASTIPGRPAVDAVIRGNLIGTDPSGTLDRGNGLSGVMLLGDVRRTSIVDNVIAGNATQGVLLNDWDPFNTVGPAETSIVGNRIGTGSDGDPLANDSQGVMIDALSNLPLLGTEIGGTGGLSPGGACTGDCNIIAGNGASGIYVRGEQTKASVLGNEIRDNGSLGIDLVPFGGVSQNDAGDSDTGGNELQNFPVIDAALSDISGGETRVTGRLDSSADSTFMIEVFGNGSADPTGYGEGETRLGAFEVTTDAGGNAAFAELLQEPAGVGAPLSATATRVDVPHPYTSEFSLVETEGCDQSDIGETDLLIAGGTGDALCGLTGDDILRGSSGGDIFDGGEGSDSADLSLAGDSVTADLMTGRVSSGDGIDLMKSIENLLGSPHPDDLTGDGGPNLIDGADSGDTIDPGPGADTVIGGPGDDLITIDDGEADVLVDCGSGNDTVEADSVAVDADSIYVGCETINRPPGPPDPVTYKCAGLVATLVGTDASETLLGTPGRDVIVSRGGVDVVRAYAGNDVICGGSLRDTIFGGDGVDVIYGLDGNDILNGDRGNDRIYGGNDRDTITGGDNADVILGGNDNDVLSGLVGNDVVSGGFGNDVITGGANLDRLLGEGGNDVLRGGEASDTLLGGNGNDSLFGDDGADRLYGGVGSDLLKGGAGFRDLVFGQAGFDRLDGGSGKADLCNGGAGPDRRIAPLCERRLLIP